jgi:Gly-Xaa carboxypeptidase
MLASSYVVAVRQCDTNVPKHLANVFNLSFTAFGLAIFPGDESTERALTLTDAYGTALEPAPMTPSDEDSAPWQLLSGTIKATYNAQRGPEGDNVVVSPGVLSGNTGGRDSNGALVEG